MATTKESKSGGMSLPVFLLVLLALAGIAAGVWLVYTKKADADKNRGKDEKRTLIMEVGSQKTLEAMLEHDYTCTSSAESVVYVGADGKLLLAKSVGEATLIATDTETGASQVFVVTVVENPNHPDMTVTLPTVTEVTTTTPETTTATSTAPAGVVSGITLSYYSASIKVGEVHPYALVTMTPADATDKREEWTSSDTKIAVVDKAGRITGVSAGKCTIRVTSVGNPYIFAEIEVTVVDPNASSSSAETTQTTATETTVTSASSSGSDSSSQSSTTASSSAAGGQNMPKPTIEVRNGVTYVNGVLIANKTYALPENYNPGVDKTAQAAFNEMQAAAAKDGRQLTICSGFRSYTTQKGLYDRYCARDGKAAADRYSARPGHSEHQTGLAFDINRASSAFTSTPEAKWLSENCWKYGFIIRYPEGKENITGYMYESWHIRYLGKDLAKKVYDSGLTLEEYLGITSKYAN